MGSWRPACTGARPTTASARATGWSSPTSSVSVVIGGHSLGVLIALRLAVIHPDRVAGIVAFGPPLHADPAAARARVAGTGPMARLFVFPNPLAEAACRWMCDHREIAARLAVVTHPQLALALDAMAAMGVAAPIGGRLVDVLIRAAFRTGADVRIVPESAGDFPRDGVGALLRHRG